MGQLKLQSLIKLFACVLFVLAFTASPKMEGKTTISDLESQMKENEKAIKNAQSDISNKNALIAMRSTEILDAESKIAELGSAIFKIENNIAAKIAEMDLTQIKIEETMAQQMEYYASTKERIKVMYEYGSTEYLEVLLESKTTTDFFNRLEYLNKLVTYDQSMLDKIASTKAAIEAFESNLLLEKAKLETLRDENEQNLVKVESLRITKEVEINRIEDDKELLFKQIQDMEEEQVKIDKMIQELILLYSDKNLLYGDGKLSWPLTGFTRVSSSFGTRVHPVYGYVSNHTGIDIPASYGAAIKASASGKVIFAGWGTAYGNYILIDHGIDSKDRHVVTQYAHCSSLLVVEGDVVVRGDVIGKAGSTGWSTGNHLHFGVQIGGVWINPLDKT